jgi:Holliday junction resolvase-like predicted endonuclease
MVQMRWIDKVFSFFKQSPLGPYWNKSWDALSPSEKGDRGERLALNYCKKALGYRIVAKNWRHHRGEIDLICLDKACLVFIEVRLRKAMSLVYGVQSISRKKKSLLRRTALAYFNRLWAGKRLQNFTLQECCFILIILLNIPTSHYGRIKTPIFRRFK